MKRKEEAKGKERGERKIKVLTFLAVVPTSALGWLQAPTVQPLLDTSVMTYVLLKGVPWLKFNLIFDVNSGKIWDNCNIPTY